MLGKTRRTALPRVVVFERAIRVFLNVARVAEAIQMPRTLLVRRVDGFR